MEIFSTHKIFENGLRHWKTRVGRPQNGCQHLGEVFTSKNASVWRWLHWRRWSLLKTTLNLLWNSSNSLSRLVGLWKWKRPLENEAWRPQTFSQHLGKEFTLIKALALMENHSGCPSERLQQFPTLCGFWKQWARNRINNQPEVQLSAKTSDVYVLIFSTIAVFLVSHLKICSICSLNAIAFFGKHNSTFLPLKFGQWLKQLSEIKDPVPKSRLARGVRCGPLGCVKLNSGNFGNGTIFGKIKPGKHPQA